MKKLLLLFAFIFFTGTVFAHKDFLLRPGNWRGVLTLNDSTELPFSFEIALQSNKYKLPFAMVIKNADERIEVYEFNVNPDSVNWHMPVFDSWFRCKRDNDSVFTGTFYNRSSSKPYELKFRAEYGKPRFPYPDVKKYPNFFPGKWECDFSPGTADSSKAIGIFLSKNGMQTGTFLTETGDYRFLEGDYLDYTSVAISCFDGSHAFLFKAKLQADGTLKGDAWYGKFGHEEWTAKRNDSFELRNPEKLTWITDSANVNFTFTDLNGKPVSLSDPQFKGKVVIIQIMGSWCPNCMDETAWMSEVYKKYHSQGLEVIALAYERSADTAKANPNIRRVKNKYKADYTFLNTGKTGKDAASASLPFLNGIMSFPTTIYIDRSGKVRMVYTGFNGPATGIYYEKDTANALRLIQQLLAEKAK